MTVISAYILIFIWWKCPDTTVRTTMKTHGLNFVIEMLAIHFHVLYFAKLVPCCEE